MLGLHSNFTFKLLWRFLHSSDVFRLILSLVLRIISFSKIAVGRRYSTKVIGPRDFFFVGFDVHIYICTCRVNFQVAENREIAF